MKNFDCNKLNLQKILLFLVLITLFACSTKSQTIKDVKIIKSKNLDSKEDKKELVEANTILASHYCYSLAGRPTASGEVYNPKIDTAAHPKLPFGTIVHLKNPRNDKEVTVRINDRGPFISGREIDLSNSAAQKLGFNGLAKLEMRIIK